MVASASVSGLSIFDRVSLTFGVSSPGMLKTKRLENQLIFGLQDVESKKKHQEA
jgi:hypothetical protein